MGSCNFYVTYLYHKNVYSHGAGHQLLLPIKLYTYIINLRVQHKWKWLTNIYYVLAVYFHIYKSVSYGVGPIIMNGINQSLKIGRFHFQVVVSNMLVFPPKWIQNQIKYQLNKHYWKTHKTGNFTTHPTHTPPHTHPPHTCKDLP